MKIFVKIKSKFNWVKWKVVAPINRPKLNKNVLQQHTALYCLGLRCRVSQWNGSDCQFELNVTDSKMHEQEQEHEQDTLVSFIWSITITLYFVRFHYTFLFFPLISIVRLFFSSLLWSLISFIAIYCGLFRHNWAISKVSLESPSVPFTLSNSACIKPCLTAS